MMDHVRISTAVTLPNPTMPADFPTSLCEDNTEAVHCYSASEKTNLNLKQRTLRRYRKSRPRRKRKGKHLRNQDLAAVGGQNADQNGNSWRYSIGAPRNDNEFLLNQSKWQLDPKSGTFVYDNLSCPSPSHDYTLYPTIYPTSPFPFSGSDTTPLQQDSDSETPFPYAASEDESETCPICHRTDIRQDSGVDTDGDMSSGYASHSPHFHRLVCLPTSTSSGDAYNQNQGNGGGPDPSFLERNFEAEYEDNLTRELQDCSKEELVLRCKLLMERTKELESQTKGASTKPV